MKHNGLSDSFKMQTKFIPYGKQDINNNDIESVIEVLKSDYLTQGPQVAKFENKICSFVESNYSVAVNSATSALHMACKALGLEKGDFLWTSPITFVASANCARYCGANVDFVDIDISTGLISLEKLEEKLEIARKNNCLPKILVPVHLAGTSCDMRKINELSKRYKFKIIEDASHAIGGFYESKPVGNCQFSDIAIFSFHPVKIITTGEGGIATTNNESLYKKMNLFRSHGITKNEDQFLFESPGPWYYEQQSLGFNYRITDIAAALGQSQLKRIKNFVDCRNQNHKTYKNLLNDSQYNFLEIKDNVRSSLHLTILSIKGINSSQHKNYFMELRKRNIGVQLHYVPVHLHPYYRKLGFKEGDFPQSEAYARSSFSLPNYPKLSQKEIIYIASEIEKIWKTL